MRARYFGTDGFRGEANDLLTAERAFSVGRFLGFYCDEYKQTERARIVIGKDTRRSSYMFEASLVAGIVSSGADAYLLHVTTTPSVAYAVRSENFDAGIMISASHNPYYDNGIKLFNRRGEKMQDEVLKKIERYLDGEGEIPYARGEKIGKSVDYVAGRNRYVGYLISLGVHSFKGIKVGLDCANGSAWHVAKSVFDALGAEVYLMGAEPDGTNINAKCGSTHTEGLEKLVKEKGLDVGFAFDGDGDRCLCVDEQGNLLDGDKILYICAKYMQARGELFNDTLVVTVMSNLGLYRALDKLGIGCEQTQVGDRFVYERMAERGAALGGEQSGHIIFSKYACTGDGILTALKLMEVMIEKKSTLHKLAEEVTLFPQILQNVRIEDGGRVLMNEKIRAAIASAEGKLKGRGRLLVRKSGTEPVVRVMAEADDERLCKACADEVAEAIRAFSSQT